MTRVTIDKRKFLVLDTPAQVSNMIREGRIRNMPVILTTKNGIVSIPLRGVEDFIITAEKVKK